MGIYWANVKEHAPALATPHTETGGMKPRWMSSTRRLVPVAVSRLVGLSSLFWKFGTVIQLGLMLVSALWLLRFAVLLGIWPFSLNSDLRAFLDLPTERPSLHPKKADPTP